MRRRSELGAASIWRRLSEFMDVQQKKQFGVVLSGILLCCLAGCRAEAPAVVTMAEYNQVKNGMSYQQVLTIVGQTGEEVSSAGAADPAGKTIAETKTYQWKNPDGSNMKAIFWNKGLMGKTQDGLK